MLIFCPCHLILDCTCQGRKLLELTPLSAQLSEFGFEGAPATDESYPAYDVFYEINVFNSSDFIGLGKRMVNGDWDG